MFGSGEEFFKRKKNTFSLYDLYDHASAEKTRDTGSFNLKL